MSILDIFFRPKPTLVSWWRIEDDGDYVLRYSDGWEVRGDCTVWHDHLTGKRVPSWLEHDLSEVWKLIEWGRLDDKKATKGSK